MGKKKKSKQPHFKKRFKKPQRVLIKKEKEKLKTKKIKPPKNRASKKKTRQLKRATKKPQKALFKIKPLERAKKSKIKKPSKPTKPPHQIFGGGGKPIKAPVYRTRIKVIGIGGGGSSIISEIASKIKGVIFLAANTDLQALKEMGKRARHFQFGQRLTRGLGTGMNPELGEMAAESDKEKIKELLKETDFCILISCLGGGTGSGASPVFGKILKNLKILSLGIFTLPFEFEGGKRAQIAKDSLEKLRQNLNALVIIPNQKIFQIVDKNTPLKETLSTINKVLIESLEGLITLIYSPGLIHVDFATLKTNLAGRGRLAYFNTVEIESPNQAEELVKKVVSNPLIPYAVQGAKEVLFNIDGGLNLNMSQVEQIGKTISDSISPQARVAFGVTQNKKGGIKITLLVNGCKWEEWGEKEEKSKKKTKEEPKLEKPKKAKKLKELKKLPPQTSAFPMSSAEKSELKEEVKIEVRRNALDLKEAVREEEKRLLAKERKWETPAFLRRNSSLQIITKKLSE